MTRAVMLDLDQPGLSRLMHPRLKLEPGNDLEMAHA